MIYIILYYIVFYGNCNVFYFQVLAHSWEIVQLNDCRGLKTFSEEGIEGLQKILRTTRYSVNCE